MPNPKLHSLDTVVESIAQLIAVTKQWMLSQETRSTQQLVLTAERIKALDCEKNLAGLASILKPSEAKDC